MIDKEYGTTNAGRHLSIFCLNSETSNGEIFEWEWYKAYVQCKINAYTTYKIRLKIKEKNLER